MFIYPTEYKEILGEELGSFLSRTRATDTVTDEPPIAKLVIGKAETKMQP